AGVKISKITGLSDDIALNLASAGVRIEAPIPNKAAVGIEVPNKITDIVTMREIIESTEFETAKSKLAMALGRDIAGNSIIADIAKMPHMLIAGATGSGKSVCINSLIISTLYKSSPNEVRFLMIDPKVVELGVYNGIPHLLVPVVTDPRKAAGALGWAVTEMLNRYKLFADNNVRDLNGYNELALSKEEIDPLPQIVIIIDELADLMMAAPNEVEDSVCRLAQMARAAGMHLVIATQRPSVDVITGVIKANIPSRIAFAVSSQVDSRTILDSGGAEKLLGRGDMLFYPVGMPKPLRVQGCFVSDKEVEQVVNFIKNKEKADYDDKIIEEIEKQTVPEKGVAKENKGGGFDDKDSLYDDAVECIIDAGQASTSYLQRKLKVGYARAARLVDDMEANGVVGALEGSKPRNVLLSRQQWLEQKMNKQENDALANGQTNGEKNA
ncbi:MAG: DNA translocase FtsK, partial [Oscillospiraceae bacterium]